jgi:hypothetical protein
VPTGGTTSQVLAKASATDYDTLWSTPAAGGLTLPLGQSLTFSPDATYDVGLGGGSRPRNLYLMSFQQGLELAAAPNNPPNNFRRLYPKSDGWYDLSSTGVETKLGASGGGGLTLPLSQNLTFSPDDTYDVGGTATTLRPRNVYVGSAVDVPTIGTISAIQSLSFRVANTLRWRMNTTGHLTAITDNTYDIGASGASRPRDLFLGRNAAIGGTLGVTGATTFSSTVLLAADPSTALQAATKQYADGKLPLVGGTLTGNLLFSADNTYDIGASGATRPRDLFLGRNVTLGGSLTLSGSSQKIIGDFTSAFQVMVQTNQVNQSTSLQVVPNGTSRLSSFYCWDTSTTTNAIYAGFAAESGVTKMRVGKLGSATAPDFAIQNEAGEAVRVRANRQTAFPGGIDMSSSSLEGFWQYSAGTIDLGNAGSIPNQIRGVRAWGGALTVNGTGSTGFIVGGGIVNPLALSNGEGWLLIARDGYWWTIARSY